MAWKVPEHIWWNDTSLLDTPMTRGQALVLWSSFLAAILWLSSCDKKVFSEEILCDFWKWTFDCTVPNTTFPRTSQGKVSIPLKITWKDITCGHADLKVVVEIQQIAWPNTQLPDFSKEYNKFQEGESRNDTIELDVPFNCRWFNLIVKVFSDEDSSIWTRKRSIPKTTRPVKVDVTW